LESQRHQGYAKILSSITYTLIIEILKGKQLVLVGAAPYTKRRLKKPPTNPGLSTFRFGEAND
jgi:hypothetical protein